MFEEKAASQAGMQQECDAMINEVMTTKLASRQMNKWRSCTCGLQSRIQCLTQKVSIDCDEIFQHASCLQNALIFDAVHMGIQINISESQMQEIGLHIGAAIMALVMVSVVGSMHAIAP
jgi:hypothetical protein